jgi:hypothetical protein
MAGPRYASKMLDFSKGIVGGVSDYGRRARHLSVAENVLLRPFGGVKVRAGSQRACSATLTKEPHTLMEYIGSDGTTRIFEGCKDASVGVLNRMTASAFTAQTTPYALHLSNRMSWDQLNDVLWATQLGTTNPPMFFSVLNPTDTWHNMTLPRPAFMDIASGVTVTKISGAGTLGGATTVSAPVVRGANTISIAPNPTASGVAVLNIGGITVPNCRLTIGSPTVYYEAASLGVGAPMTITLVNDATSGLTQSNPYFWRLRYRYRNGSSIASAAVTATTAAAAQRADITNIVQEARSDYVGWTLERTKPGGNAQGPWYFVIDGTGSTYSDKFADSAMGAQTDPEIKHGEPLHYEGVIAHRDRLFGWAGSTLYASQAIGDLEATGVCNWNALVAYDFGKDDGDSIQAVVRQNDRLIILKKWSVWALEGFDAASFIQVPIYTGAGAAGPRCAGAMGGVVWFFGDAGLHQIVGNEVKPFGWEEIGHIFDAMNKTRFGDVVVKNYLGQLLLVSFSTGGARNDSFMVYDQRFGGWTKFTNWFAQDILVQRGASFGDAQTILMADARDFGGGDYRTWMALYGFGDEKHTDGSAGAAVRVQLITPWIDDGTPDVLKMYERLEAFAFSGVDTNMSLSLQVSPNPDSRSFSALLTQSGIKWGSGPLWGTFKWGQQADVSPFSGLRPGLTGTRYRVTVTANCAGDFQFKGFAADVLLLPERRMS